MALWNRVLSVLGGRRIIIALGGLHLAFAFGWAIMRATLGTPLVTILMIAVSIGGSGLVLLIGGYRLPRTDVHPSFYVTIASWCLTAVVVMLGIITFYHLEPSVGVFNPERSLPLLTGFSSVAGFGVGLYAAQAKTSARDLELQNRKLQHIQTQLEESNERLEQFAYVASHDLQEPLRMISSYLQLIESRYGDELDEDGEEFLEYAIDGSERMRAMVEGLLEYSRVETQGQPFEPVDLSEVVANVLRDLELQIDDHGAAIEVDELPTVDGDAAQLQQLLQNLLSNAIAYSGDEPPRIEIVAERDGGQWIVSVRDEGIGIDPAEQERIFEVFQRLHSHEEQSGTGIGLAVCKRIVERHNGEIWVDSEPGEGTTFSFTVPAVTPSEVDSTERPVQ